jgi:hypothetical protein
MWADLYDCTRILMFNSIISDHNSDFFALFSRYEWHLSFTGIETHKRNVPFTKRSRDVCYRTPSLPRLPLPEYDRKALYPDEYPEMWAYQENGKVDHNSFYGWHIGTWLALAIRSRRNLTINRPLCRFVAADADVFGRYNARSVSP